MWVRSLTFSSSSLTRAFDIEPELELSQLDERTLSSLKVEPVSSPKVNNFKQTITIKIQIVKEKSIKHTKIQTFLQLYA